MQNLLIFHANIFSQRCILIIFLYKNLYFINKAYFISMLCDSLNYQYVYMCYNVMQYIMQ